MLSSFTVTQPTGRTQTKRCLHKETNNLSLMPNLLEGTNNEEFVIAAS